MESELSASPVCPHCQYRPSTSRAICCPPPMCSSGSTNSTSYSITGFRHWWRTSRTRSSVELRAPQGIVANDRDGLRGEEDASGFSDARIRRGSRSIVGSREDQRNERRHQGATLGGSPATPDDLRKRFETLLIDRCKGKDTTKLRSSLSDFEGRAKCRSKKRLIFKVRQAICRAGHRSN